MNRDKTATSSSSSEDRSRARDHLARQIGRLLACEWLQKQHDKHGEELRKDNKSIGDK
jgi:hypothetical protein